MVYFLGGYSMACGHMILPLLCMTGFVVSETVEDEMLLRQTLLQSYNKEVRPPYNHSQPLAISVGFTLRSMLEVDEVAGVSSLMGALVLLWYDDRLTWDPTKYSNLSYITLSGDHIWFPQLYVSRPAGDVKPLGTKRVIPRVYNDGQVSLLMASKIRVSFNADMTYFPFDIQVCKIHVIVGKYLPREMYLQSLYRNVSLSAYVRHFAWDVIDTAAKPYVYPRKFDLANNRALELVILLRRKPLYFTLCTITPIYILLLVNPMVFVLPPECGERVSFSVTMLLSYGIFLSQAEKSLPEISNPTSYLSWFLLYIFTGSAMAAIVVIMNSHIYFKDASKPVPAWLIYLEGILSFKFLCRLCQKCKRNENKVEDIHIDENENSEHENESEDDKSRDQLSWQGLARCLNRVAFAYSLLAVLVCTVYSGYLIVETNRLIHNVQL